MLNNIRMPNCFFKIEGGDNMLISVIIPTLGTREKEMVRLLESLNKQTYQQFEVIVVSQDHHDRVETMLDSFKDKLTIIHLKSELKGLSIARNLGLSVVSGDIVTFSDDDCWYPLEGFGKVISNMNQFQSPDIFCFQIYDPEQKEFYKNYHDTYIEKLNTRQIFQRSSIEIFIKLGRIQKEELFFNEQFGLGAKYPSGEENIMLNQLHKKGYSLTYINEVVVYHLKPSQQSRLNIKTFNSKGPLFKEMFGPVFGSVMLTALFVKKYKSLDRPIQFYVSAFKEMLKYKRSIK
jgi:glycosyltransferase involved in cell wall biosynthesis